jgi:hypothetical protein
MKQKFLSLATGRQLKKNTAVRVNIPYQKARLMGVLFTVEDRQKHEEVKEFVKKLELDGKQVAVMSYLPNKKENYEFLFDFFTLKDISFFGQLQSAGALKFADMPFDFLYCCDLTIHPVIKNVLARSKAHCRVGRFTGENQPYFELMLDSVNQVKSLTDTMFKYTRQLK